LNIHGVISQKTGVCVATAKRSAIVIQNFWPWDLMGRKVVVG